MTKKICLNCKKEFSIWVTIEGKKRNLSSRKYCLDCSPFQKHNTRTIEKKDIITYKTCKICKEDLPIEKYFFVKRKDRKNGCYSPYCKECSGKLSAKRLRKYKMKLVEYKGGCCEICGYNRCYAALELHHTNPQEKDPNYNSYRNFSFEKKKSELDKCILVCANCHRELHSKIIELPI